MGMDADGRSAVDSALPLSCTVLWHGLDDLGSRHATNAPAVVAFLVLPAQPRLQLAGGQIKRCVRVACCRLRPDHRTSGAQRDLHSVRAVGLPGVVLLGHLDVEADHLAVELLDLLQLQLLGHVLAEPLGHLGLAALDDDVHAELRSRITPHPMAEQLPLAPDSDEYRSLGLGDFHLLLPRREDPHPTKFSISTKQNPKNASAHTRPRGVRDGFAIPYNRT